MSRFVRSKGIQKVLSVSNIKISRHTFVFHYSWNGLVKCDENRSNLHTLLICSKWLYSLKNQMRDFSSYRFANNSRHSKRLSRLLKPQTDGTGPPGVNDNGLTLYDITRVLWFPKVCLLLTFRSQKRKMKLYHWTDRRKRLLALSICKNTGLMAISKELVYMAKKKKTDQAGTD